MDPVPHGPPVSAVLVTIADEWPGDRVTMGDLLDQLGDRGFGLVLLILALPNLIPIPLPIASLITGPPLVVIATLMLIGRDRPWLPDALRRRSILRRDFQDMVGRARRPLMRLERLVRPRLTLFPPALRDRVAGAVCLIMGLFVCVPLPLTNWLPAAAIALIAIAIIEQDGVMKIAGFMVGLLAIAMMVTYGAVIMAAIYGALAYVQG